MKLLLLLLLAFTSGVAQPGENALESLVFDFSSEVKSKLSEDGWITMDFSVVHYNEKKLNVAFKAICVESGLDLAFYPRQDQFQLLAGEQRPITLFMNRECGMLENLEAGKHNRTIRFQFVDVTEKDTLTFDQQYVIQVK